MSTPTQAQIAERLFAISEELKYLKIEVEHQSIRFDDLMRSITRLIGNDNDNAD